MNIELRVEEAGRVAYEAHYRSAMANESDPRSYAERNEDAIEGATWYRRKVEDRERSRLRAETPEGREILKAERKAIEAAEADRGELTELYEETSRFLSSVEYRIKARVKWLEKAIPAAERNISMRLVRRERLNIVGTVKGIDSNNPTVESAKKGNDAEIKRIESLIEKYRAELIRWNSR